MTTQTIGSTSHGLYSRCDDRRRRGSPMQGQQKASRFRSPICEPGFRKGVPSPTKGRTLPVETLTAEEVDRLMRATNRGITGKRTKAVIAVLYRAGLRVGECCNLRPIDVNFDDCTIRVLRGKTANADRMVGIDPFALEYVADGH